MMTARTDDRASDLLRAARAVQIWGLPLVFAQRVRLGFTAPLDPDGPRPATSAGAPLGTMGHQRELSDPSLTAGVAPNVDTLYSLAFVDLDRGDATLRMPDVGDRYYSVQIGEADSTTAAVLGVRTHGSRLPTVRIGRRRARSSESGEDVHVRCRTRYVMVAVRILVRPDDRGDTARVRELQKRIVFEAPATSTPNPAARWLVERSREDERSDPAAFIDSLDHAMRALPRHDLPPSTAGDLTLVRDAVSSGDDRARVAVSRGLADGLAAVADRVGSLGRSSNGWSTNLVGTDFGTDHLLRAAVAWSQIYVNPSDEALYPVCEVDRDGDALTGEREYTLTLTGDDPPPVRYFWSITVYHKRGLLCDNPIGRYAITDRTPGLRRETDGSVTVRLATADAESTQDNWLPVPPGPFRLMMRLYGPLDPSWSPPPVVRS